jgi:DNA-binding beta-propeller fold protein YncE
MERKNITLCAALALAMPLLINAQSLTVTTFAGPPETQGGSCDGTLSEARFNGPYTMAIDAHSNMFVADSENATIRKITPAGAVTTLAGLAGQVGSADGNGAAARFDHPNGVAVDSNGIVYVADTNNNTIRKITPDGTVTTLAGVAPQKGATDGPGSAARFYGPQGVAVDNHGNVFVVESGNYTVRKINAAGVVSTFAGAAGQGSFASGYGSAARFYVPTGIAVGGDGNLYVGDSGNHCVRKITPDGFVSSMTSTGTVLFAAGVAADAGGNVYVAERDKDAVRKITPEGVILTVPGLEGMLDRPRGVALDGAGNLYVADTDNDVIRKVAPDNSVSTFAGIGRSGGAVDAVGNAARFNYPNAVASDDSGNLYVADTLNNAIRKITPNRAVTTFAGLPGTTGDADGTGSAARFQHPFGLAIDRFGNLYVGDSANQSIRQISPAGEVTTLAKGLAFPRGVAVDFNTGKVYVASANDNTIRVISTEGVLLTFAGLAGSSGTTDGNGFSARFDDPSGVAVDFNSNVYVSDSNNHTIRKITPDGTVSTFAGRARSSGSADGTGSAARFYFPGSLATDRSGNIYVHDWANMTIRKITQDGVVTTVAGTPGKSGNVDGPANTARFDFFGGIAVDGFGKLYVADAQNNSIRSVSATLPDAARIDAASGLTGATRVLDTTAQTATSWEWSMIRQPSGSSAALSSPTVRNPTFTPDVAGLYQFRVIARSSSGASITTVSFQAHAAETPRTRSVKH